MTTRASEVKNVWIAAGDGDLERVKDLIENHGLTPESPDSNTYTPLHAAASYAQLEVLTYLLAKGGNINVTDNEGETPLFTVESVATARWLIEHGADPKVQNLEGQTAADFLEEDSPEVAAYLRTLLPASLLPVAGGGGAGADDDNDDDDSGMEDDADVGSLLTNEHLSSLMAERLTEEQTTTLMGKFEEIMKQCEEDGVNRDAELAELVQSALFGAMEAGRAMGDEDVAAPAEAEEAAVPSSSKRSRTQPDR